MRVGFLDRAAPAVVGVSFAFVPLYPSFITLAGVSPPGVSLLPRAAALSLFALCAGLAAILLLALLRAPHPRAAMPVLLPLGAWLGAAAIASALGFDPAAGALFLIIFGLELIWHAGILQFYERARRTIWWSFVCSGLAASLAAIALTVLREPEQLYAIAHGRAVGSFVLPGELAGYLIVFLPCAFALTRVAREPALRVAAGAALIAGSVALILTFSRAGWVGLAAAAAAYLVWNGSIRRRYAWTIVAAGVAAVLALFNAHHNPSENYTRLAIWQTGLEIVRRFPLTGVGAFDFARLYAALRPPGGDAQAFHAHNVVLTIFAETGLLGIAAMFWAWWRFAAELRARIAAAPGRRVLALALAAGLAGTWVQGLIDTVSVVIFGLWLPSMALALACAAAEEEE